MMVMAMMRGIHLVILFLFITNVSLRKVVYNRHKLIRIIPDTNHTLSFLQELSSHSAALQLDFWSQPSLLGRPVDIHLEPDYFPELREILEFNNISFRLLINDLQRVIQKEYFPNIIIAPSDFDSQYNTYPVIVRELQRLSWTNYNHSRLIDIGTTYEYRKIYAIEIFGDRYKKKPVIFLNCGMHAREWISPATCMYIARQLLSDTPNNVTSLRSNHTWIILPVLNVDGYQYSHTSERFWRKNRSVGPGGCIGVDLNRNFNHQWGNHGTSPDPCNLVYHGRFPFSEPESYALAKYLMSRRKEITAFIDMHSFGQLFMSPWGHTTTRPTHYEHFQEPLMEKVTKAIADVYGKKFLYGPASIIIYPTTGDSTDWCYQSLGIIHSYSVELRPTFINELGFIVPPNEIIESGKEILNGLVEMSHSL